MFRFTYDLFIDKNTLTSLYSNYFFIIAIILLFGQLNVPVGFIQSIAKLGDKFKLALNTEHLNKLTENYVVSKKKIKVALGKELPIKAREGLRRTILSFKVK